MTVDYRHEEIRDQLSALVARVRRHVPEESIRWIDEWIDVGEYGVAFEHLIRVITEERVGIRREWYTTVAELGSLMSVPRSQWSSVAHLIVE